MLEGFLPKLESVEKYDAPSIEECVRNHAEANKVKARQIIHPLRFFITGRQGGPGLFETMELIGKERCLGRIRRMINDFKEKKEEKTD
jgi:glutamyl/glutaminyl-tRNA synthetase